MRRAMTPVTVALMAGALFLAGMVCQQVRDGAAEPVMYRPTDADAVTVRLSDLPGHDCWFEVGYRDVDGLPGGVKTARVEQMCP